MIDPNAHSFLMVQCDCHADLRLASRELVDDALIWACAQCARPVDLACQPHQWVDIDQVQNNGYVVEGFEPELKHGDGGCRDGQCGVAQP